MSDNRTRGFLEDIIAHPDDDAPRLIFADWLEDHGDSVRAEFIRVQIERARLPEWDARQVRLRLDEVKLIEEHGRQWKAELPEIQGITWGEFRRGFVSTAWFSNFAVLWNKALACWAAAPVEAVVVRWPHPRDANDTIGPIPGLRELFIEGNLVNPMDVDRLAAAPLLSTLRALNIGSASVGAEGFRRLVASPHLGNLRALRLPYNSISNAGVGSLLDAASLTSLEELDLSEANNYNRYDEDPIIEAAGVKELVGWSGMSRLRSLTLSGNAVGRAGLRTLLRSPQAVGLKELILRDNGLNGSAMQEFGAAREELQLDVLDLGGNLLGDLGAGDLALASCLRELKVLQLDRCEIPLSGARWLVNAPFLTTLRRLNVNYNSFAPEGVYRLLEKKPPELHTLQLRANDLGDEGVFHLAESRASDTLLELDLAQNRIADAGMQALAKSKRLRNLLILRLNSNPLDRLDAALLRDSPLGKRLAVLEMSPMPNDDDDIPF